MKVGWLPRFLPLLAGLLMGVSVLPSISLAQDSASVTSLVIAEQIIAPGDYQIIQVTVRNPTGRTARMGLRVHLRDEAGRPVGSRSQKTVTIAGYDETRAYFRVRPPRFFGQYQVHLEQFSANFSRRLKTREPRFYAGFEVGDVPVVAAPGRDLAEEPVARVIPPTDAPAQSYAPPTGLAFEAADLIWENFELKPPDFLVGDVGTIRAEIRNIGGDIARNVDVRVKYFNTRVPNRLLLITDTQVQAVAPGEKIELEFEFSFPADALLGEYKLVLDATMDPDTPEADRTNNRYVTDRAIKLSRIRLVFPESDYEFEEAGLFLFRWESRQYDEFKVQVGVEKTFENENLFFDIPQGEKWTKGEEVTPLSGELPGMAKGLLLSERKETVYWRVLGRSSKDGETAFSQVRAFTIKLDNTAPPPGRQPGPEDVTPQRADPNQPAPETQPTRPARPSRNRPPAGDGGAAQPEAGAVGALRSAGTGDVQPEAGAEPVPPEASTEEAQ